MHTRGMDGGGFVPSGSGREQDADEAGGGHAEPEIDPRLAPELTEGVSCGSRTDDRRDSVEDKVGPWSLMTLEGVMNFGPGTIASWYGYSKTIPKRRF
jgi:hypothetical protein